MSKLFRLFNPSASLTAFRYHVSRCATTDTLAKTYQTFFGLAEDDKITRYTFESYAAHLRTAVEKNDKIEAFFTYAGMMKLADMYGLTKFPEDGGEIYTIPEICDVLRAVPRDTLKFHCTLFSRALFRGIDTDGDGFISRDEWAVHLKARNSYESDEQALRSFNSLDTNEDGHISLKEFEDAAIKFWSSGGSDESVEDYHGTKKQ